MNRKGQWWVPVGIVLVILVLIVVGFLAMHNNFVYLQNNVNEKYANLESQYQRRVDLIPNLVSTVKGAGNYESATLTKLTELRSQWQAQPEKRLETANEIESALSKLLVVNEAYPELTATQSYRDLTAQLEGTENRVNFARTEYNAAVKEYNTSIQKMPGSFVANSFGFKEKSFFELLTKGAENAPVVDFN